MSKRKYRTANIIIQTLLEGIIRAEKNRANEKQGIVKSHLIDYANLKTSTAEKYLSKLIKAGYIDTYEEAWGDRTINIFKTTEKGRKRYEWFVKINTEMEESI